MVGNTWKAKMKPNFSVSIRLPKMNDEPAFTKLRIFTKPWPSQSKAWRPPGTSNTSAAKATCRLMPVATSFQSTAFLLLENANTMPISTASPNNPKPICPKPSSMYFPECAFCSPAD